MMRRRRRKCPTPDKLQFTTRHAAELAMRSVYWQNRLVAPTRVYWCRCGHFHMTSRA